MPEKPEKKMKHVWMVEDVTAAEAGSSKEKRSYWTRVGIAYENADGSWSLQLSAVPVTGKMQLRDVAPQPRPQVTTNKIAGAR